MTTKTTTEARPDLTAHHNADGWHVRDADGGVWWPDCVLEEEIERLADPIPYLLRACGETPTRGRWAA